MVTSHIEYGAGPNKNSPLSSIGFVHAPHNTHFQQWLHPGRPKLCCHEKPWYLRDLGLSGAFSSTHLAASSASVIVIRIRSKQKVAFIYINWQIPVAGTVCRDMEGQLVPDSLQHQQKLHVRLHACPTPCPRSPYYCRQRGSQQQWKERVPTTEARSFGSCPDDCLGWPSAFPAQSHQWRPHRPCHW